MFLRAGSQLQATTIAFALLMISMNAQQAAADTSAANKLVRAQASGVELPREVLPWRRKVERQADEMLSHARRALGAGKTATAERYLNELLRKFPRTHAANDGERELRALRSLRERRITSTVRRGLGIPPQSNAVNSEHESFGPIAGWNTIVKPVPLDLRDALIEAAGDRVFFENGSTKVTRRARAVLKKQARWLKSQPKIQVRIVGHADDKGTKQSNMRLSHDRAVAVRKRLIRHGISPKRLHVFSHGKAQPIAICSVQTCAVQNRRVVTEIRLRQHADAIQN